MTKRTLVVIGGDAAGMGAAAQARRNDPELEIIAYERGEHTSYIACGMPYMIAGLVAGPDDLVVVPPHVFRERYDIQMHTRHEVIEIDPSAKRVRVERRDDGHTFWQSYDELLIATGAVPIIPDLEGATEEGVFALKSLASGIALATFIEVAQPKRAVIVGGGYIGLEMAEALRLRDIDTTLIDLARQVMVTLDEEMATLVVDALSGMGVQLYLNEGLVGFETHEGRVQAVVTDQRTLPADLVILGMGIRPNSDLARAAGIPLGVHDAIRVTPQMQTETPHIWAAGDCTESIHRVSGQPVFVALGTVANKTGRIAGLNLTGVPTAFPGVLGTAITKVGETEIARTGLNSNECEALGLDYVATQITDSTPAGFYPGASDIHVRLLAEPGTGRLLGGQIVGGPGSGKRIDTIAACLTASLTVQDLVDMDLSYAPPFSPVWDPVQTAARVLLRQV
jgi:NADPH-dependent 2,4-dienoyl-CoA reductase/sulfur reductase-like enzyme